MVEYSQQMFRGEWHSYQGASSIVEACSRTEAVEKERRHPFSGADLDLHEELDNVFVVPAGSPVAFLFATPGPGDAGGGDVEDGRMRKYVVSATYRKIYAGDVLAATAEEALRHVREQPELRSAWTLIKEMQHIVAIPLEAAHETV